MSTSVKKTASFDSPHAIIRNRLGWEVRVLKVNRPAQPVRAPFNSWFCAVSSPMTFGTYDYGDTYVSDIIPGATLEYATDEFKAYWRAKFNPTN